MSKRRVLVPATLAAALVVGVPLSALAEAISIDHLKPGCVVAGKYPKLSACFTPLNSLAQARLYFRAGGTPTWYFVNMTADAEKKACHVGVILKPQKAMIGKTVDYYVEAMDKSFTPTRTEETSPKVVASPGDCEKDKPVAPFASKASVVASSVGGAPVVPAGFATGAGLSTTTAVIVTTVGVAGAGFGIAAATDSGGSNTNTTVTTQTTGSSTSTLAPTPPPPTPPPPTNTPLACRPAFSVTPDPPTGFAPLEVTFDMCATTGNQRRFQFDFDGDGITDLRGQCSATRTYTLGGVDVSAPTASTLTPPSKTFTAIITAGCPDVGFAESQSYAITVTQAGFTVTAIDSPAAPRRLAWGSQLEVPGSRAQIVVNGESAVYTGPGRSSSAATGRRGENRIEAQLVAAAGPGLWRFELAPTASLDKGSLKVIAGEAVSIGPDSIVFRMAGKPGERVVFTFRTGR